MSIFNNSMEMQYMFTFPIDIVVDKHFSIRCFAPFFDFT